VQVLDNGECRRLGGEKIVDVAEAELQDARSLRASILAAVVAEQRPQIRRLDPYDLWPKELEAFRFPSLWDISPVIYPWRLRLIKGTEVL
jgi:hypothetical protein